MSGETKVVEITVPASADLSGFQYRAVFLNASGSAGTYISAMATAIGGGTIPLGVLTNKPTAAGQGARVAVGGVAKMLAGAVIAAGELVTVPGQGGQGSSIAVNAAGTYYVLGQAKTRAAASGDIFEVIVNPRLHARAV